MTSTRANIRHHLKELTIMNRTRASLILGSLFAGALVATACSPDTVEGAATPEPASTAATPAANYRAPATYTPPVSTASEDLFITLLESQDFNYGSDEDLAIDTGESVCSAMDRDTSIPAIVYVIMDEGYDAYDAGVFLGASVYALCDEHVSTVEMFLDSVN